MRRAGPSHRDFSAAVSGVTFFEELPMFGIGMPELILIAVVALIVLGPKKLPDLAKSMGRAVREFKKATSELKETLQVDSEFSEVKKAFTEFRVGREQDHPDRGRRRGHACRFRLGRGRCGGRGCRPSQRPRPPRSPRPPKNSMS